MFNQKTLTESQDFIGRFPAKFIRLGAGFTIAAILILSLLGYFISFNQTLSSKGYITSNPPPVTLISKQQGYIEQIKVGSGENVIQGQTLAVLKSPTTYEDITYLDSLINSDFEAAILNTEDLFSLFQINLRLEPEIQESYNEFVDNYLKLILQSDVYIEENTIINLQQKENSTAVQLRLKNQEIRNLFNKYKTNKEELEKFERLYQKGVLSENQIKSRRNEILDLNNTVLELREEKENLEITLLNLDNAEKNSTSNLTYNSVFYKSNLNLSKQKLKGLIRKWKELNLFISPIAGKVSTFNAWHSNQEVVLNDNLFTIVPNTKTNIYARCKIPVLNTGSLKIGQEAVLFIENFPFAEWGTIKGVVSSVSDVPKSKEDPFYYIDITIPSLETSLGKKIDFKHNMNCDASIILKKHNIYERILLKIRKNFKNQ